MHVLSLRRVVACHGFWCNDFCNVYPSAASTAHTRTHSQLKKGHFYFPALGTWTVVENKNGPFVSHQVSSQRHLFRHRGFHIAISHVEPVGMERKTLFERKRAPPSFHRNRDATCENALSTSEKTEAPQASTGIGVQLVKTP